jgi:hypothetical protein
VCQLLDQRFSFIREQRLRCHKHQMSFLKFGLGQLLGTPETTTRMTGYANGDPRHMFQHYCGLPLRRLTRALRKR